MTRIIAAIDRVFELAIVLALTLVVLSVTADVVARYGLRHSIMFVNELSRLSFIWITFLVMPLAIGRGMHVAITALEERLSVSAARVLYRAGLAVVAVLMAMVVVSAVTSVVERSDEPLMTLPITVSWFFVPVALGGAHALLHLCAEFIRGVRTQRAVDID